VAHRWSNASKNAVLGLFSDPCSEINRVGAKQMPTDSDLRAAIARRHLEDLRARFGRDNQQIEALSRLLTWSRRLCERTIEEELLGG